MIGLVYVSKIIDLQPIEGADFILSATVVCGLGVQWRGVVKKQDFDKNSVQNLGEGNYESGNEREGVVVRCQEDENRGIKFQKLSLKVINLNYET